MLYGPDKLDSPAYEAWRLKGAAWGNAFSARMLSDNPELSDDARKAYQWAEAEFLSIANSKIDADTAINGYGG